MREREENGKKEKVVGGKRDRLRCNTFPPDGPISACVSAFRGGFKQRKVDLYHSCTSPALSKFLFIRGCSNRAVSVSMRDSRQPQDARSVAWETLFFLS